MLTLIILSLRVAQSQCEFKAERECMCDAVESQLETPRASCLVARNGPADCKMIGVQQDFNVTQVTIAREETKCSCHCEA